MRTEIKGWTKKQINIKSIEQILIKCDRDTSSFVDSMISEVFIMRDIDDI